MRPEEVFDSFYRSTRDDLLHQAFLLTGDVRAASGAVRDAYVTAWQHWARVTRHDDPLEFVRPLAWRHAQRRHRGRIWHRNRGISEADRTVLDVLDKIPVTQRRLLLLTEVARLPLPSAARETALTVEAAEIRLQTARETAANALGVDPDRLSERLASVGYATAAAGALPRTSIVMRAGQKRRRVQGAALVAGTLAVTLAAGAVANAPGRQRPGTAAVFLPSTSPSSTSATIDVVDTFQLVTSSTLTTLVRGTAWTELRTDGNAAGNGLNSPCQATRFADPNGASALVRVFATDDKQPLKAVETVETSRNPRRARAAYRVMVEWFAACHAPRTQLRSSYTVDGVGEQGLLVFLRSSGQTDRTIAVAIARTGTKTMSLAVTTPTSKAPGPRRLLSAASEALTKICGDDPCVDAAPELTATLPRFDSRFGLLAAVDLPAVGKVDDIWVGTEPSSGKEPTAGPACRTPSFRRASLGPIRNRTFLIPQANLPPSFGLVETAGSFRTKREARSFASSVSAALRACAKQDFTEDLVKTGAKKSGSISYTTWFLRTRLSRRSYLNVRIAVVQSGLRVALVAFTPTDAVDMTRQQFNGLALRAAQRLGS